MSDGPNSNSRRNFLKSSLIAISSITLPGQVAVAAIRPTGTNGAHNTGSQAEARFFEEQERGFLEAAVDRLIPPDERWPGAAEAGVVNYIDLQMAGDWGKGNLIYRHGPFRQGSPAQGYQLEYTPAELFRRSISAINRSFSDKGTTFSKLSDEEKDAYLEQVEKGEFDLDGVPSNIFFDFLWKHTQEGFFADPIYGGNKNKVGWKMLGFPGAYTDFYDLVDKHGLEFYREPVGIADGGMHMHMKPAGGKE